MERGAGSEAAAGGEKLDEVRRRRVIRRIIVSPARQRDSSLLDEEEAEAGGDTDTDTDHWDRDMAEEVKKVGSSAGWRPPPAHRPPRPWYQFIKNYYG